MIKRIFYFVILLFLADFLIGVTCDDFLNKAQWRSKGKDVYILNKMNADFLILGSSRAEFHYVSKTIQDSCSISTFNMGKSGSGVYYSYAMLRAVLNRYTPKYILFDIVNSDLTMEGDQGFSKSGVLSSLKPYTRINHSIKEYYKEYSSVQNAFLLNCNTYCYNSEILNLVNARFRYSPIIEDLGYKRTTSTAKNLVLELPTTNNIDIDEDKLRTLHNFITLIKDRGIKLIICYSPSYHIQNPQIDSVIYNMVEQYNVPYYGFANDTSNVNKYDFADETHLKYEGACTYTKELIPILKKEFNLE